MRALDKKLIKYHLQKEAPVKSLRRLCVKKAALAFAVIMVTSTGTVFASIYDSLWVKTGSSDIYNRYTSGKVGIGSTPVTKLDVYTGQQVIHTSNANGTFTTAKYNTQGVAWSSSTTLPAYLINGGSADRPEISFYRGGRMYPEFALREHATQDYGGEIYSGNGQVAPTLTMQFVLGKVGIGCTPAGVLCVNGGVHVGGTTDAGNDNLLVDGVTTISGANDALVLNNATNANIRFTNSGNNRGSIYSYSGAYGKIHIGREGGSALVVDGANNIVGIGTTNPSANLEIASATSNRPIIGISGYCNDDNPHGYLKFQASKSGTVGTLAATASGTVLGVIDGNGVNPNSTAANAARIWFVQDGSGLNNLIPGWISFWTGTNTAAPSEQMRITSNGTVAIGTTSPGTSYRLVVNGKVGAREVVVTQGTWSDFVFNDDYKLKPLDKVAEYVKKNKHLEGIPTAAEVKKSGVPVGEMQAKLLQKVEELTLYTIAMKKENDELRTKVEDLEKRIGR